MWAHTATPADTSGRMADSCGSPDRSCRPIQKSNINHAGTGITRMKMNRNTSRLTRTRGYRSKYAPTTPEIAPDAPTMGTGEAGLIKTCAAAAARPHSR